MKVGDYVRTKYGITQIKENVCLLDEVIKSSPNIIDLIEVGDYVNGHRVLDIAEVPKRVLYLNDISQKGALLPRENINSIVTHERFSQIEYRIGE